MTSSAPERPIDKRYHVTEIDSATLASRKSLKNRHDELKTNPEDFGVFDDTDISWVFEALSYDPTENPAQAAVSNYIQKINELVVSKNYKSIDFLLRSMDPDQLPLVTIVTFVRTTYPVRIKIPEWKAFRDACAASIRSRDKDSMAILRGV